MSCPFKLRADLPPLTDRLAALPLDERGYPIPFFVAYLDGKPEFRAMDGQKWHRCVREKLCWVCGQKLGRHLAFTIGPMCVLNRTTSEPPAHLDCAEWSVRGCPFLSRPNMVRREDELTREAEENIAGLHIKRNPGAMAIWVTPSYEVFRDERGLPLIQIGPKLAVSWWREGRTATREEILEAIDSGLPFLRKACDDEPEEKDRIEGHAEIDRRYAEMLAMLPP